MPFNNTATFSDCPVYIQYVYNGRRIWRSYSVTNFTLATIIIIINKLYFGSKLTYWKNKTVRLMDFGVVSGCHTVTLYSEWWTRSHWLQYRKWGATSKFPPKAESEAALEIFINLSVSNEMLGVLVCTQLLIQVCLMKGVWWKFRWRLFLRDSAEARRVTTSRLTAWYRLSAALTYEMWPDFFPAWVHSRSSLRKRKGANPMEERTETTLDASFKNTTLVWSNLPSKGHLRRALLKISAGSNGKRQTSNNLSPSQLGDSTETAGQGCASLPLQDLGDHLVGSPQAKVIIQVGGDLTVPVKHLWGEEHAERVVCPHLWMAHFMIEKMKMHPF